MDTINDKDTKIEQDITETATNKTEPTKKLEIDEADIDKEVIDKAIRENIINKLDNETDMNRIILNALCELLVELRHLRDYTKEFSQMLSVCSAPKMQDFFIKVNKNLQREQKLQEEMKNKENKDTNKVENKDNVIKMTKKV
jgi:hypothetical protein